MRRACTLGMIGSRKSFLIPKKTLGLAISLSGRLNSYKSNVDGQLNMINE